MKESDLFEPAKSYLLDIVGCDKVYAEVADLDVVGKKGNLYIGIEMKTSLNFKVIEQAERRKHLVDYMFVLVPKPKTAHSQLVLNWLKSLGIGLMYYNERRKYKGHHIAINHWGTRRKNSRRYKIDRYINEEVHTINIGGTKSGETITPYKLTIDRIKHYLLYNKGWKTVDDILLEVETHYTNPKPSTIATLKENWNAEWVEVEKIGRKLHFRMREDYRQQYGVNRNRGINE